MTSLFISLFCKSHHSCTRIDLAAKFLKIYDFYGLQQDSPFHRSVQLLVKTRAEIFREKLYCNKRRKLPDTPVNI